MSTTLLTHGLGGLSLVTGGMGGSPAAVEDLEYITLLINSIVTPQEHYHPLTGVYAVEEDLVGWKWDIRSPESRVDPKTRGDAYLGGHLVGLKDGTQFTQWQSGSLEGTDFSSVKEFRVGDYLTWTPVVHTGRYSTKYDKRTLYSDYSISERIDPLLDENDNNVHTVRSDCIKTSIGVVLYERDKDLIRRPKYMIEPVETFTGEISGTSRLDTVDSNGDIIWDNLAGRTREFILDGEKLYFNGAYQIKVGDVTGAVTSTVVSNFFENKGEGSSDGRLLFTNYFPIANNTLEVHLLNNSGSLTKWKEVVNLNFSTPTDKHYSVDYDLGIVTIGGYTAPDLILYQNIDEDDVEVVVYVNDDTMRSYPDQGVIKIGTEEILYYGKGRNRFFDCVRGHNSTTVQSHTILSKVSDIQHGADTYPTDTIYIKYTATPRVEYEVTPHEYRTANASALLNVKAISNVETNNIIQISPVEPNLAKVELEIDRDLIGGSLYGPVHYGTDVAKLTARALDSRDSPVEDIELTIVLNEPTGSLNGSLRSYKSLSNSLGEIYAFYNAPYDEESVSKTVDKVEWVGSDTRITLGEEIPVDSVSSAVTIYQILKHDGVFGTTGVKLTATSSENSPVFADDPGTVIAPCVIGTSAYYEDAISRFDNAVAYVDVLKGGVTTRYMRTVIGVTNHFDRDLAAPAGSQDERGDLVKISFLLNNNIPELDTGGTATAISLIQKAPSILSKFDMLPFGEQEWNPTFLDGVRVLVYEWQELVGTQIITHPLTGKVGAYYPVRPSAVTTKTLTYSDRKFPIPAPNDQDNNLGGYIVIAPTTVSFYAWGKDPVTGRIITSNTIKLKLALPVYLDGVKDPGGALPIPYGFTFVTEDFNVGTGLGGANFITINSAKAPLYIDADPPISDSGANTLPIYLKVGF